MARRDSPRRKQEKAEDVARHLLSLQRTRGVLFVDATGLWLLGRPAQQPADADQLATVLLGDSLGRTDLAGLLRCEEATLLEPARLAKWQWSLVHLEGRRDLAELIREGVRPLRGYRGVDFTTRLRQYRQALDSFRSIVERGAALAACQQPAGEDSLDVTALVSAAPARLRVLGSWPIDPVELLRRRDVPADAPLLALAHDDADPTASGLATVMLGLRSLRASPVERQRLGAQVPARLVPLFFGASENSPVLQALAFDQGRWPLPALAGIPESDLDSILLAAERCAVLFGLDAGLRVLSNLACPWGSAIGQSEMFRERLQRFEQLIEEWQRGGPMCVRSPAEAELAKNIRLLGQAGQGGPRLLARVFVAWISGDQHGERLIGGRPLVRIAAAAWPRGPRAAVAALAEAWQKEAADRVSKVESTSTGNRRARLAVTLAHIEVDLTIPAHLNDNALAAFSQCIAGLPRQRVREVSPLLPSLVEAGHSSGLVNELFRSDLSPDVLARAVRLGAWYAAATFSNRSRTLVRYLDCVEALGTLNLPEMEIGAEWLAELFRSGPSCLPGVVLTLVRQVRGGQTPSDRAAALRALSQDLVAGGPLAEHSRALARALEVWDAPVLIGPAEMMLELAGVLGREPDTLRAYLHHRRLAGYGETFAKGLLDPLELPDREAAEADFLRGRLPELPEDAPRRAYMSERLARLSDPEQAAARRIEAIARTRQRLDRSLELLRQESLERTLDDVYRTYLGRLLGKPIRPGPLPAGMREALALLHAQQNDTGLLLGFLDDVLEGRDLAEREPNRLWLERARMSGIDTRAWLAGVHATVEVAGEPITFASERDPLHVLRMGSYFETCLTLESGFNAASTLLNALDVNKQVIYGRRADGAVVARKLIGATAAGEMAGYATFAHDRTEDYSQALHAILADLARRCGLRLADRATPEVLHKGFWYDDGNEPWISITTAAPLPAPPASEPSDDLATGEWHLVEGLRTGDVAHLAAVVRRGTDEPAHAALFRLLLDPAGAEEGTQAISQNYDLEKVIGPLLRRGSFHWLDHLASRRGQSAAVDSLRMTVDFLPFNAATVRRIIKRLKQEAMHRRGQESLAHGMPIPATACTLAGVAELIELYESLARLTCPGCLADAATREPFLLSWTQRLQMAWLRDREARSLVRALENDTPGVSKLVVELATREVIPGLAPALRSLAKRREVPDVLALALGTQGQSIDGPRLVELLRHRPRSLELAVAVVRTGHAEAAEEARRLWRPIRQVPDDGLTLSRLRELASPALCRQLRRDAKDLARIIATPGHKEAGTRPGELHTVLCRIALLGQPGPDGEPAALLASYAGERAFRDECWWYEGDIPLLQRLWEQMCILNEQMSRLEAGESEPLARWAGVRERAGALCKAALRDERLERLIRRIAADRDDPRRVQALTLWMDLAGGAGNETVGLLPGLLGDDLAPLGWPLRDRAALALGLDKDRAVIQSSSIAEMLVWLRGRSWGQADGLLEQAPQLVPKLHPESAILVLHALESSDPEEARTARAILDAHAQHAPDILLSVLDQGFLWLRPEVIEPLAEELARSLCIDELSARQVDAWLVETGHSYRWQRLLLEVVRPRFAYADPEVLTSKLRTATDNPRAAWLLGRLSPTPVVASRG
jgi:hypothetical protein